MSAMLREAGLLKELEAAKERIRQLEAQSVAVVGEPVAWVNAVKLSKVRKGYLLNVYLHGESGREIDNLVALYLAPTTAIPAAELASLREKAAMVDELRKLLEEARDDVNSILNDILVLGNYPHNQRRIQIQQELLAAIDAAIAQGKGE